MPKQKNKVHKPSEKWKCECGKQHEFGVYTAAHWDIALTHSCECGRGHTMQSGRITLVGQIKPDNAAEEGMFA